MTAALERSQMSAADINDLPDDAFAYIEEGGSKDEHGRTVPRSLRHFPIHDEAHVRNALSRAPQSPFGDKAMPKIRKAAKRMGIGDYADDESRSDESTGPEIMRYDRSWALDDIVIRSGGDGRTVEAYAAVFDTPSEIKDQHGHYMEVIHRSAFNRAISHGINRINVLFNHGLTVHGNADALGSVPIGSPVDIQPDGRGLRTVTRYNRSQLADSVLEAIRAGDIRGYSFRGRIFQSNPQRVPRQRPGTALPTITRTELGLAEYGPTPTPAYADAGIVAVRSVEQLAASLVALDREERAELVRMITGSTLHDPETDTATPDVGPGTEDSPDGRSGRFQQFREELRKRGVLS
jgi:HK97 family phage prohead protease